MRRVVASVSAALAAGLLVALLDLLFAGASSLLAAAVIVALDVTAALVCGLVLGGLVLASSDAAATERVAAAARALFRPAEADVEARRVAWLAAVVLTGAVALVLTVAVGALLLPGARGDRGAAIVYGAAAVGVLLAAGATAPAAARLLVPLARRSRLSLRVAAALVVVLGLIAVVTQLRGFLRAVDLRVPLLAALFAVATGATFVLLVRRGLRARLLLVPAAALVALWLVTLGPASHDPRAVAIYRGRAPVAGLLAARAATLLDLDGDGYAAFLGDGDCAPGDARRHPGAREVAANGLDDDCFDGDLTGDVDLFPPPAPFPPPMTVPRDLSFVVILVDSMRADHLGLYGYPRATSPHLDLFAEEAIVFERAYAAGPYTAASIPAIHTGQHAGMLPPDVLRRGGKIGEDDPTMAELMVKAGRATAMVSDNGGILTQTGVARGFERSRGFKDSAAKVTGAAMTMLESFGRAPEKPFFLWVDYFAPHSAYVRHAGVTSFGERFIDYYDHEIAFVDGEIAQLLARLDQPDLRGRVAVVVMADHGEAFGEHGTYYHGHHLHEELVHVPLLMRVPGLPARRLGREPVSLIDVLPTLLNLARAEAPPEVRGHDLTRAMVTGQEEADRHVFSEAHFTGFGTRNEYQSAVVTKDLKLIEDTGARTRRLYELTSDPAERRDLAAKRPEDVIRLRRAQKFFQSLTATP